jgi:arylsulfatase I/J
MHGPTCIVWANLTLFSLQQAGTATPIAAAPWRVSAIVDRWCQGFHSYTTGVGCRAPSYDGPGVFEDDLFATYAAQKVAEHSNVSVPLLLFFSLHAAHTPLQVPAETLHKFDDTVGRSMVPDKPEHTRQVYTAMVHHGDAVIGRIVTEFRKRGLWNNSLFVYTSDNGGPSYLNGTSGGNNFPLTGGKMSNYEGGIRVSSIVSGGLVPMSKAGSTYDGLVAVFDWYAMFVTLAGGSLADPAAAAAGLPPVDAIDLSAAILGIDRSAPDDASSRQAVLERTELAIGTEEESMRNVAGLLMSFKSQTKLYKLLTGIQNQAAHSSALSPNSTQNASLSFPPAKPDAFTIDCGDRGCLFELLSDEGERYDLAARQASERVLQTMHVRLQAMRESALLITAGSTDQRACDAAMAYGGFWGPWMPNSEKQI